jgi:hypothetical protein
MRAYVRANERVCVTIIHKFIGWEEDIFVRDHDDDDDVKFLRFVRLIFQIT